ncbi:hypothetical protein [Lentzea sp. NPDC092896]|uniref:hypothetical protein n=1 Tax=Lentzea sp. NPDC092896 TaxID=3364127 RepID=UPI00381AB777
MTTIHINPGTGAVPSATVENAIVNINQLVLDVAAARENYDHVLTHRIESADYGDGRYAFIIVFRAWGGLCAFEVQMPGLPLEQVNYGARDGDSPWDFPRLYVDDSSWLWKFAIDACLPDEKD